MDQFHLYCASPRRDLHELDKDASTKMKCSHFMCNSCLLNLTSYLTEAKSSCRHCSWMTDDRAFSSTRYRQRALNYVLLFQKLNDKLKVMRKFFKETEFIEANRALIEMKDMILQ